MLILEAMLVITVIVILVLERLAGEMSKQAKVGKTTPARKEVAAMSFFSAPGHLRVCMARRDVKVRCILSASVCEDASVRAG